MARAHERQRTPDRPTSKSAPRSTASAGFAVSVTSSADGATSGNDYEPIETAVLFQPGDFTADGPVFEARKTVELTIPDDAAAEADEDFAVRIAERESLPDWLSFREADGTTACDEDGCLVTVTITGNDNVPSVPQNLAAEPGAGEVMLTWAKPADPLQWLPGRDSDGG